jgi:long-chain acyl-CoA synthetase
MQRSDLEPGTPPWQASYPPGARWDHLFEPMTVTALFDRALERYAGADFIEYAGRPFISYGAFGRLVERLAAGLAARGVGAGTRVALFLPNTPWHPAAFLALAHLGAKIVQVSALDAKLELAEKLADCGARILLTTDFPPMLAKAAWLLEEGRIDTLLVGEDTRWSGGPSAPLPPGTVGLAAMLDADGPVPARVAADPNDLLVLQYTGGTSGMPKAAMLSHNNLTSAARMYTYWEENPRPEASQRYIAVLPFFHIYGLVTALLMPMLEGQAVMIRSSFDVGRTLTDFHERGATMFTAVPAMWGALISAPDAPEHDFSRLNTIVSGGSPLPMKIAMGVEKITGTRLINGWGLTETSAVGARMPRHLPPADGAIGVPIPGILIRIVSLTDRGTEMALGEIGEIAMRGPNVFSGYWNDPEATEAAFYDGWFMTGDVGSMDERGVVTYVDRSRRLIFSGGFNVYPAAIERAIEAHPAVAAVIVIGIADEARGEATKAFVMQRPGTEPLTMRELRRFLEDRLGRHEIPVALEVRDTLPRSPIGKLMPAVLAAEERAKA